MRDPHSETDMRGQRPRWKAWTAWGATCLLVAGLYIYVAHISLVEPTELKPADAYYNLLVRGFRAGHLYLDREVPPSFAQLADPYDPIANAPYRLAPHNLHDTTYYNGRLYLDFGITPALVLFGPFALLTGQYLFHGSAVAILSVVCFLTGALLVRGIWRQYFPEVSLAIMLIGVLAFGLATLMPVLLTRPDIYEVAITCGVMLTMLALAALWCAVHQRARGIWWLAAASVAYGLAVGARPNLLFGAVILLVPVIQARREGRPVWPLLTAAVVPILMIGCGLMFYNTSRFGNPFEFGKHYVLREIRQDTQTFFSVRYFWFNFRALFLEPVGWCWSFPYVQEIARPALPAGHWPVETPFGLLLNVPFVWLGLLAPLAWWKRSALERGNLRTLVIAVAMFGVIAALTICFFCQTAFRYQVEFLPALLLPAIIGVFGIERGLAGQPFWRSTARWGWGPLLAFSIAFNVFAAADNFAGVQHSLGVALMREGKLPEAVRHYKQALDVKSDYAEAHSNLGAALAGLGQQPEAIAHCERALSLKPDLAGAHNNMGLLLAQRGRQDEAIEHLRQAVKLEPSYAMAHYNLAMLLQAAGNTNEAAVHFMEAQRLGQP